MPGSAEPRPSRLAAARREGERVTVLELFFDLVFVLGITQCTTLITHHPSWGGLGQGLLALGIVWWGWVGYAWLTSVIDPEEVAIRLVMFAAMAAMLIVSLCVPEAFGSLGLTFALAFGVFRVAHIALFMLASTDDDALRHSILGFSASTVVGVSLLVVASFFNGLAQGAVWALALLLDMAGPYVSGAAGWRLVPAHFAERHGLIVLIALGESIVDLGVGAAGSLDFGSGAVAVLGMALAAALWWVYFDIVALISARRLGETAPGQARNELARDSYSYVHLVLVAGIVLVAFGLEAAIGGAGEPFGTVPAFGLLGGVAVYLLGLVAFRYRHIHTVNRRRLGLAVLLLALVPAGGATPAWISVAFAGLLLWSLVAVEHRGYGEARERLRRESSVARAEPLDG